MQPGDTASFGVRISQVTPATPRQFSDSLEYVVNGVHRASVVVRATVIPPTLTLSTHRVVVSIGSSARNDRPFSSVALRNPLGYPIEFEWVPPSK